MSIASELQTLFATAASGLSAPAGVDVRAGEPDVVNVPTIAYWYMSTRVWGANTLNKTQEISDWRIRVQLPSGPRFVPADAAIDAWLEDAVNAIRSALWGAVALGGAATGEGLELTDAKAGWLSSGDQFSRVAEMDLGVYLSNVHTIVR